MGGLREHVEGVQALQAVAGFSEMFQVAGEGAGVAGNVDDLLWVKVGLLGIHVFPPMDLRDHL